MEIDAVDVARHKSFCVKPSFVDKIMDEKKIGELSTEEMQEIVENAVPATTKKPQSSEWQYSRCTIIHIHQVSLKSCQILYQI